MLKKELCTVQKEYEWMWTHVHMSVGMKPKEKEWNEMNEMDCKKGKQETNF